jgi:4-phytase/acid phosphatase
MQALVCFVAFLLVLASGSTSAVAAQTGIQPRFVLVLTRHGVRSPTSPAELAPYAAQAWPKWEVAPGYLTPHGAALMRQFGTYYRSNYSSLFPKAGCPASGSVFVWADVDERTIATGKAMLDGIAPGCSLTVGHGPKGKDDLLFDPLPTLGRADTAASKAAVLGAIGSEPNAVVDAYRSAYDSLDRVLACTAGCKKLGMVATTIDPDPDTGLSGVSGGLDAAGTAAENLLLEYTDGMPTVGWGRAEERTILNIMQLHAAKSRIEHETYYNARTEGSNLLEHIAATLDQAAAGASNSQTRVPVNARFAVIVGHDTSLSKMAGMLHLSWLMKGYLFNDTPPGGALVFEVYTQASKPAFIRLFFNAQSLAQMRSGDGAHPARVPVYVPGCPDLDCPVTTFDAIVQRSLDKRLVGAW